MKYKEAYNHYRQDLSEVSENRSLREAEKGRKKFKKFMLKQKNKTKRT